MRLTRLGFRVKGMAVWTLGFGDVSVPVQSFETVVSIFCGSGRFAMMVTIVITRVQGFEIWASRAEDLRVDTLAA